MKKKDNLKPTLTPPKRGVTSNQKLSKQPDIGFRVFSAFNDTIWLVMLIVTGFFAAALFSFDMNDPAFTRSTDGATAHNMTGMVGAYVADIAYYLCGLSIWWVVIEAAILLFRAFKPLLIAKKIDTNHRLGMGALGTIIMIAGSGLLETWLGSAYLQDRLPLGAGGFWGQTIVPILEYGVGRSSGVIISMLLMLMGLSMMLQMTWLELVEKVGNRAQWLWFNLIKRPSQLMRELPKPRKFRQTVATVEDITATPVATPTGASSNRKIPTPSAESADFDAAPTVAPPSKPAIPVQTSLFDDEPAKKPASNQPVRTDLPHLDLLQAATAQVSTMKPEQLQETAQLIETKLAEFVVIV